MQAAVALAAQRSYGDVTIADIAERAGMTPAAIYYHFSSKEDVLLEGLRVFGEELSTELRARLDSATTVEALAALAGDMLRWLDKNRGPALVFFVTSAGLNGSVEASRSLLRGEIVVEVAAAVKRARGRTSMARARVLAAAYLSLTENAARSWLARDDIFRKLGARRLREETVETARRILLA